MTDAFDQLELQLRRAVRGADNVRSLRPRGGWRRSSALALAAALVVSGAALAGNQVLGIGKPIGEPDAPKPDPHVGAGVVQGGVRLLPVRAADPAGGPPWALRVFHTSRETSCVQVGRVYGGHFGLVRATSPGSTRVAFRELRAVPGINSLCGGVERDGFPVLRGLRREEITGGQGDPRRCRVRGKLERCPISSVRILRYGLLGPAATHATFVDASGRSRASMAIRPGTGGAYLFAIPADPHPYQRVDRAQRDYGAAVRAAFLRARHAGRSQLAAMKRAIRSARGPRSELHVPRVADGVVARFADGRTLRVAGPGRTSAPLPGVERRVAAAPAAVRAALDVRRHGTGGAARFTVRFRAPVAIARADRHYTLTVDGPWGASCTRRTPGGGLATTRDIARGESVSFNLPPRRFAGSGRRTWCPGAFTINVGYQTPDTNFRGRVVGRHVFKVP